uniref:Oxidoreductase n=1 Tax=Plectus sambesii TaxID=2011161 RepID=A0A914VK13_9BILA
MSHPRTVLVTGASRGIGLELVKQLAALENGPVHIFAACRNPDAATDLQSVAKAHSTVHVVTLDAEDDNSIDSAVKEVQSVLKDEGLNLLVNNAGILEREGVSIPCAKRDVYQRHFNVNATGPVMITQAFLPLLQKASSASNSANLGIHKAAVVNISSMLGSIAENTGIEKIVDHTAYRMTKTALNQLTKTLSIDLAKDGILVVSFCPGWVQTDMGGSQAMLKVNDSVSALLDSFSKLSKEHTGGFFAHTGQPIKY